MIPSEAKLTSTEAYAIIEDPETIKAWPEKKVWEALCDAQLSKAAPIIEAPLKGVIAGLTDALERTKETLAIHDSIKRQLSDKLNEALAIIEAKEREVAQARKAERERIIKQIEELNLLLVRFDGGGDSYTEVPLGSTQEWAALKGEQP